MKVLALRKSVSDAVEGAFEGCETLETLRSEEGLVLLGDSCLKGCTALKKVQLPSSVRHLDDRCFEDFEGCTSLSKVDWLGDGSVQIGKGCFKGVRVGSGCCAEGRARARHRRP